MKIRLAMVMSLNAKTTKGDGKRVHEWTSKEDQKHFSRLLEKSKLVIMGRKTFDSAKSKMQLSQKTLRVVMTKNPSRYKDLEVRGQLEFTNKPPRGLVLDLQKRGFKEALLVGGAAINAEFFKARLVNEIVVTIEPYIFGEGLDLVSFEKAQFEARLLLKSIKKLNTKGTLLLLYALMPDAMK